MPAAFRRAPAGAGRALMVAAASIGLLAMSGCATAISDDDQATSDQGYLSNLSKSWANYYGVTDPPPVSLVRYIGTEETDSIHRTCLLDAGYERDGLGLIAVPAGQEAAFALAEYTCRMQYPVSERHAQKWSAEQVRIQYSWTAEFVVPCLEAAGHPIEAIPSESVFSETWASQPYFPFAEVRLDAPTEQYNDAWAALEDRCPQIAPGEVLWDGMEIAEWVARRK